mmetsp:Transcript_10280/g.19726  ORF Transcript_10280/g.19726 Transcript_10280/m.19726 type:complete len:321 (-) Transcript_10280:222-1184(-)
MNIMPGVSPISPLSDENAMMRWVNQRPRLQTDDTLQVTNGISGIGGGTAHHIHSMSNENPFLPTDDEIEQDASSDVSSLSNDSMNRFKNWVHPTPEQEKQYWAPFVPPLEIVITIKKQDSTESTPEWLQLPLRNPSAHGPPAAAFAPLSGHHTHDPVLITNSPKTAPHPTLQPCDHLRNMSWATETTISLSLHQVSSQEDNNNSVDRPKRRHARGVSHQFCIGDLVGQSSFAGGSLVSAPTSTSFSMSGDSFSQARRANRKLDELVADPIIKHHRKMKNPLKEEVLYVLDKVSQPVKRLVKTHRRCQSYDLHASKHGCLA